MYAGVSHRAQGVVDNEWDRGEGQRAGVVVGERGRLSRGCQCEDRRVLTWVNQVELDCDHVGQRAN